MITQFLGREDIKQVVKTSTTTIQLNSGSKLLIGGVGVKLTASLTLDKTLTGIGGLDIGSIVPNSFYYVFVVIVGNTEGLVASLNTTPTGFTAYRLIAGFNTDSAGLINSVSDRYNLVNVKRLVAAGNAGQAITANVTNLPFIASIDEAGAWNGSQYIVPFDSDITINGGVHHTVVASDRVQLTVNGVFFKNISNNIGNSGASVFYYTGKFLKGNLLTLIPDTSYGLTNSATFHHLTITAQAESQLTGLL